jgi:crotonobetainyl-CoA:carnitine CoA-transferase CaiB-like acyl-CoA transferase
MPWPDNAANNATGPLAGIRVLDLTRALAGPFCAMILGDLGADVIKVEPMPDGEMIRAWGPFDDGVSVYYLSVNRNKRSLALDFRNPDGLRLLREMAAEADIVVENFKPGTVDAMEIGYDALLPANPRIIYASITGFGPDGPYGTWSGFDQIAQGMSGLMSITGFPEGEPTRVGLPISDLIAGMWAALGVTAAVVQRHTTGKGQRVETSLLAAMVGMLCIQGQRYLSLDEVPNRMGNDHPVIYPYGAFTAKDGLINVAVGTQDMWAALCRVLDLEDLTEHSDFADNSGRSAHRDALRDHLNARFATRPAMEWTHTLTTAGIPAGPIYTIDQVFADPQVIHSKMVEEVEHPLLGTIRQLANPLRMDSLGGRTVCTPPPLLGEHSEEILKGFGYPDDEIAALIDSGVIGVAEGEAS